MPKILTTMELKNMQEADLIREISHQYRRIGKTRLMVKSGKEKAHHFLKIEKKQLARMLTILSELRKSPVASRIPPSSGS